MDSMLADVTKEELGLAIVLTIGVILLIGKIMPDKRAGHLPGTSRLLLQYPPTLSIDRALFGICLNGYQSTTGFSGHFGRSSLQVFLSFEGVSLAQLALC